MDLLELKTLGETETWNRALVEAIMFKETIIYFYLHSLCIMYTASVKINGAGKRKETYLYCLIVRQHCYFNKIGVKSRLKSLTFICNEVI